MGNLSTDTTREDLIQLLGLRNTTFYGANVRTKLVSDTKHKYKRYALLEGPRYIMNTVLEGAILLASEALTDKFQGQEITYDRNNLIYTFSTKKTVKPFMITIQSTPLITNDELGNALRGYGEILKITKQGHKFANNIDSGLRKIFVMLNNGVQTRDIPGSIRTSDGIWRKLSFKGKLYFCGGCGTKHTYTEGCPVSHDEQREQNSEQSSSTPTTGHS